MVQNILESYAYTTLDNSNVFLQARACSVYKKYGRFDFQDHSHLLAATNKISNLLKSDCIVVKVEAALAISELLNHQEVVDFIRPNLGNILRIFLKIMDDVDYDDLIVALKDIVDKYGEEVAPYSVSLCQKLSEAYLRLLQAKGNCDDEDNELGLTADGILTAIRRILNSISGRFP